MSEAAYHKYFSKKIRSYKFHFRIQFKNISIKFILTFPIHDKASIVQSHFVLEFFSKCKCMFSLYIAIFDHFLTIFKLFSMTFHIWLKLNNYFAALYFFIAIPLRWFHVVFSTCFSVKLKIIIFCCYISFRIYTAVVGKFTLSSQQQFLQ